MCVFLFNSNALFRSTPIVLSRILFPFAFFYYLFFHFLSVNALCTYVGRVITCRFDNRGIVVYFPAGSTSIYRLQSFQTASGAHPPTPTYPCSLSEPRSNSGRQHNSYTPNAAICPREPWGGWQLRNDTNRMQRAGVEMNRKACYKKLLP